MALTPIAVTTDLETTEVVALTGPIKIRADGLAVAAYADPESRYVDIYEEDSVQTINSYVHIYDESEVETGMLSIEGIGTIEGSAGNGVKVILVQGTGEGTGTNTVTFDDTTMELTVFIDSNALEEVQPIAAGTVETIINEDITVSAWFIASLDVAGNLVAGTYTMGGGVSTGYAPVPVPPEVDRTRRARLLPHLASFVFEGYGNYKFVASHADITLGYASSTPAVPEEPEGV